jgi:hypothetical protein
VPDLSAKVSNVLTVSRLSVTPVRGLALHHPDRIQLDEHGVVDDRRFTLLADGRVFDGTKFGPLVQVRADLEHEPERLTLTFPTGEVVTDEVILGEPIRPVIYDRRFTARPVIGPWADALSAHAGRSLQLIRSERLPGERDRNPVSILSEASVEELSRQGNEGRPLDARRFRMLIHVAGATPHQEDEWMGSEVRIGEAVVRVTRPDPRCVITTQDPDTGHRDFPTLHAIKAYRGMREGRKIDFGVYADVVTPGTVMLGDEVAPIG